MRVEINDIMFESKKALKKHAQVLVSKLSACVMSELRHVEEFKFFCALLKKHYMYNGLIVDNISLSYNKLSRKNDLMYVTYENDYGHIFSWVKCCADSKRLSPQAYLAQAMRGAINPHIQEYSKTCADLSCAYCGSTDKPEVDHAYWSFSGLQKRFVNSLKTTKIPTTFDNDGFFIIFKQEDAKFKRMWIKYHNSIEDNYQILCGECNSKKSNN